MADKDVLLKIINAHVFIKQRKILGREKRRQDRTEDTNNVHPFQSTELNSAKSSCSDARRPTALQRAYTVHANTLTVQVRRYTVYAKLPHVEEKESMHTWRPTIQKEELIFFTDVQKQFSTTTANHLQQAESTDFALTSCIRANFLFSKESGASCFCFFHFLLSVFSCSSRCASALFFDLCISWRRSYVNVKETSLKWKYNVKEKLGRPWWQLFYLDFTIHMLVVLFHDSTNKNLTNILKCQMPPILAMFKAVSKVNGGSLTASICPPSLNQEFSQHRKNPQTFPSRKLLHFPDLMLVSMISEILTLLLTLIYVYSLNTNT